MRASAARARVAALVLAGCVAGHAFAVENAKGGGASPGPSLAAETIAPLEPQTVAAAQARLAFGLLRRLDREQGENIAVSPASLAAVLALLDLGAAERMRRALHRTLGFDRRSALDRTADLDGLRATVTKLASASAGGGPLTLANAVIFDPAAAPYRLALMGLRAAGAEVSVEDLSKPETLQRINDWVAARTNGLVASILDEPPRHGGLVALNALHFKDHWRRPFDPSATAPASFRTVDGRALEVRMMRHAPGKFLFRRDGRFVAIDLPYARAGFSMVIVTTRDDPAPAREFARVVSWMGGDGFIESDGELALPRFSLSGSVDLLGALDALGMRRGRQSPTALRGFSPTPQAIARVVQRTELRVDEAGTEAAAATAVTTMRSMPTDYVKMVVDKPFVFALRDGRTGLILLSGYFAVPPAARAAAEAIR